MMHTVKRRGSAMRPNPCGALYDLGILAGHPANLTVDGDGVPVVAGGGDVVKCHTSFDRGDGAIVRAVAHADIDAAAGDGNRRAQRLRFLRFGGRVGRTSLVDVYKRQALSSVMRACSINAVPPFC